MTEGKLPYIQNDIYFDNQSGARRYWIASPYYQYETALFTTSNPGFDSQYVTNRNQGFRPVIVLSSDVLFEVTADWGVTIM